MDKKEISIASIGCGPAIEINNLCSYVKDSDCYKVKAYLVDFDKRVLERLQDEIQEKLKVLDINNFEINFIEGSIRQILKSWDKTPPFPKLDYIYICGLFDYFSDSICIRLTDIFFDHLKPKGILLLSNVSRANSFRAHMELGGEWYLNYRDKDEMLAFGKTTSSNNMHIEEDESKTNIFLKIQKNAT